MLNLIENPLKEKGWLFARLDGSMTLQQRKNQLDLMSLKAGGLGLNLTEANYVFMLDPWWNRMHKHTHTISLLLFCSFLTVTKRIPLAINTHQRMFIFIFSL
jgi:hypothetical protein